jgi:very-short-patch-repair endonuclease
MPMNVNVLARVLRRKSTWAEKRLWAILRDRRFSAYKFRRQHGMGRYVLDFYCAEARYNLELDGGQHGFPEQQTADKVRDEYLKSRNIVTRRFWNSQLKDARRVRASHPENEQPEKAARLPTRLKKSGAPMPSHPSPRPSPR